MSESAFTAGLDQAQDPQSAMIEAGVAGNVFAVNHAGVVNDVRCAACRKDSPLCFLILVCIYFPILCCLLYADTFLSKQLMIHLSVSLVRYCFQRNLTSSSHKSRHLVFGPGPALFANSLALFMLPIMVSVMQASLYLKKHNTRFRNQRKVRQEYILFLIFFCEGLKLCL